MPRLLTALLLFLFIPAAIACSDRPDSSMVGPDAQASRTAARHGPDDGPDRAGPGALSVLDWNVYYGTDLAAALGGDFGTLIGLLQATDMPARAEAVAEQIAAARPDVVTLQEVATWGGGALPASYDYLDLLTTALEEKGADYEVAAATETFAAAVPGLLQFTESLVILAREDLTTGNAQGGIFQAGLPIPVEFGGTLTKGWASVQVTLKGRTYRVVTTHLEPADVGPDDDLDPDLHGLQLAQGRELLGVLEGFEVPVILTGDLNSNADGSSTKIYELVTDSAGFVDTWLVGRRRGDGHTAGQDADLQNEDSALDHRIDYVMFRDARTADGGPYRGSVHAERLGEEPADRTDSGLWPSDHAGVMSVLRTEQSWTP